MESMGQQFRAARERKRINISRAAALTRIKVQHLEMMENDNFSQMPAPTYARGFIRIYAGFLGLDPAPLLKEYTERHLNPPAPPDRSSRPARRSPPPTTSTLIEETEPEPNQRSSGAAFDWKTLMASLAPRLRRGALVVVGWLPRILVIAVVLGMIFLMSRCISTWRTATPENEPGSEMMRADGIMREPPDRYLEIPAPKESAP